MQKWKINNKKIPKKKKGGSQEPLAPKTTEHIVTVEIKKHKDHRNLYHFN